MIGIETLFSLSLLYAGVASAIVAILLTTAGAKTIIDVAMTTREWLFVLLFLGSGILFLLNIDDTVPYRLAVMIIVNSAMTILMIGIFAAHRKWRKRNHIRGVEIGVFGKYITIFKTNRKLDARKDPESGD